MTWSLAQSEYLKELARCQLFLESQSATFETVSQAIFKSLKAGGVLHVFGSGHSHSFAEEMFHRAGGLVPVNAWLEDYLMPHAGSRQVGPMERLSGLSDIILKKYEPRENEVLLVASNSGINAVAVEVAEKAKKMGLFTVAVTSLTHSRAVPTRAGRKLFEVVDHVVDTGTPVGDACVGLVKSDVKVGPLSGVLSLLVGELLSVRVAELFSAAGLVPPVYQSANTPGGDERNAAFEGKVRERIRFLR